MISFNSVYLSLFVLWKTQKRTDSLLFEENMSQGSKYWRFDPDQRPPVKDSYPRHFQSSQWL
jgi:hypothetical protein